MKYFSFLLQLLPVLLLVFDLLALSSPLRGASAFVVSPIAGTTTTTLVAPLHSSSSSSTNNAEAWKGKTVYQRFFYRLQTADVDTIPTPNAMVVEERLRYRPSVNDPTYLEPFGPRTLVLREGQVDQEGAIGDAFCTIHVHETPPAAVSSSTTESSSSSTKTGHATTLQHGGRQATVTPSIALALVMAALPTEMINQGHMLEIAAREGLGALMGCMGANFAALTPKQRTQFVQQVHKSTTDAQTDVLTVPEEHDKKLPDNLESLTITESDVTMMDICQTQIAALPGLHKVTVSTLDWRIPHRPMTRGGTTTVSSPNSSKAKQQQQQKQPITEYQTVVLADTSLSFPETRELVRTVAYKLAPSSPLLATTTTSSSSSTTTPTFIHVTADARSENQYVRQYLQHGCRMTVNVDYVTIEKLSFGLQAITSVPPSQEDTLLDDMELEVTNVQSIDYQVVKAIHHMEYAGEGSGEIFFPMLAQPNFSVSGRPGSSSSSSSSTTTFTGLEPERESPSRWP
jgi:hypothetical protein